jgi:hypothetical protein
MPIVRKIALTTAVGYITIPSLFDYKLTLLGQVGE